jgi:hypothetical protein
VPSKKQRRRREKSRRHEYEYVYVDEEGQEVEVDPAEARKPAKDDRRRPSASSRPGRKVNPPSWSRAIKRGGIFAALFVVVFTLVLPHKKTALPASIALALIYGAAFVPMIYLTERMAYRAYLRRTKGQS